MLPSEILRTYGSPIQVKATFTNRIAPLSIGYLISWDKPVILSKSIFKPPNELWFATTTPAFLQLRAQLTSK